MKIFNIGMTPHRQVAFAGNEKKLWNDPDTRKLKHLLSDAPHVLERHCSVPQRFLTPLNDLIASVISKSGSNTYGKDLAKVLSPIVKALDNLARTTRDEIILLSAIIKPIGSHDRNYLPTLAAIAMDHVGPKYKAILSGEGDLDKVEQLSELHGLDVHDAVSDFHHFSQRREINSLKDHLKANA